MFEKDNKLWLCSSNQKNVYKEIEKNPFIELCTSGENISWLKLSGKVVFTDDLSAKGRIYELSPLVKNIYQTPDNPNFEVFI